MRGWGKIALRIWSFAGLNKALSTDIEKCCRIELQFFLRAAQELESICCCFSHFIDKKLSFVGILFSPFLGDVALSQQRIQEQMVNALMRLDVVLEIRIIYSIFYFSQRFLLKLAVIGKLDDLIEEGLLAVC